ncbi:MAG: hypothetical protein ACRCUM_03495 [Mycoplasmoidaceae bacterium]
MKNILKFLFSISFLALTAVWILFAVELAYPDKVNLFANWDWFQNNLLPKITASYESKKYGYEGFQLVIYSGSILLLYTSAFFLISKIPVIGEFIKSVTSLIGSLSLILVAIGIILWAWAGPMPF